MPGSKIGSRSSRQTFSKLGFTNENHCLMQPSTSRPLSLTSRSTMKRDTGVRGGIAGAGGTGTYTASTSTYPDPPRRRSTPGIVSHWLVGLQVWHFGVYLHVKQLQDPRVIQGEDALQDQHVGRVDGSCLGHALVLCEGVDGDVGPLPAYMKMMSTLHLHDRGRRGGLCDGRTLP